MTPTPCAASGTSPASSGLVACICCGGTRWVPTYRVLQRCAGCGFLRAEANPSDPEVRAIYQEDYFNGKEYANYVAEEHVHRTNFAHRFRQVLRLAGKLDSLFEVGCAYGYWLEQCSSHGIDCAGVDLCPEAVDYAVRRLGQKATAQDFLSLPLPEGRYQGFCMWDTIEHLAHPEEYVSRIHRLLPPGGWLFLTTGDIGSRMARQRGPRWRMIHPPTHLQYFARDTMTRFLGRHGFAVVDIQSTPVYRSVGEVLGRLDSLGRGLPRQVGRLLRAVLPRRFQQAGFWLDLGDIMAVAARKAASSEIRSQKAALTSDL